MEIVTAHPAGQLDGVALDILRAAVSQSSIAKVAGALGYSRPAVSQALALKYPGDTRHLRSAILETLQGRHDCPALAREVSPGECASFRARSMPSGPRSAVARWESCQRCAFNPGGANG